MYIFLQFWAWFLRSFFMLFPEATASCDKKKVKIIFAALYFYLYDLKKYSQILKILFQTGNFDIFVLCGIFFS